MSGWLEFEDICKNFHGVAALKHISFKAYSGQVLSLVGENGAGKSTLLKILGGDYQPSSGTYRINGEEKHFASPYEAIRAGDPERAKQAVARHLEAGIARLFS